MEYIGLSTVRQQNSPPRATWSIEIPRQAYVDRPETGTPGHSLRIVARRQDGRCWHVRLVVEYALIHAAKHAARRTALAELCDAIDFGLLPLLNDTLTEVYVHVASTDAMPAAVQLVYDPLPGGHAFNPDCCAVFADMREDPLRVLYPPCDGIGMEATTRLVEYADICVLDMLAMAASTARIASEPHTHVLKTIDRPLYMAQDSEALRQELRVLERIGGQGNIVRLVAAVVSDNPYNSGTSKAATRVLRGILLQHHTNGTLAAALEADGEENSNAGAAPPPWRQRAAQLCTAVATLHDQDLTHMDIKPSNALLDKHGNLVLIDVGGAGGVTYQWVSPAMQQVLNPLEAPLKDRKYNDIWAVGKVLSKMADKLSPQDSSRRHIEMAANEAMRNPDLISLWQLSSQLARTKPPL